MRISDAVYSAAFLAVAPDVTIAAPAIGELVDENMDAPFARWNVICGTGSESYIGLIMRFIDFTFPDSDKAPVNVTPAFA